MAAETSKACLVDQPVNFGRGCARIRSGSDARRRCTRFSVSSGIAAVYRLWESLQLMAFRSRSAAERRASPPSCTATRVPILPPSIHVAGIAESPIMERTFVP